jgi:serine protease Do
MKPSRDKQNRTWIYGLAALSWIFLLMGLGVGVDISHGGLLFDNPPAQEPKPMTIAQGLPNFVALAKKLKPGVVNISTTQTANQLDAPNAFGQSDRFGAPSPREQFKQRSLGSGFIVEPDGLILTNYHVVDNAEKITVRLLDGRELAGKVVGKDQKTDIALVKISAQDLPVAPLGDSDRLEVGEWVMAIGNPFGLDNTVTSGIVSAKDRQIGAGPYDHFIQTDASINPGNSGGPLINLQGEVVGIDTAIFSQSGGNIGIGFAIPINLVKDLLPQLKNGGKIARGWLGVSIQGMTPDLAASLGLDKAKGALVSSVVHDGPAERAGIKAGDVVLEYAGKEINHANDLPFLVASTPAGKTVSLSVFRDKRATTLAAAIGQLKEEEVVASNTEKGDLGLTVEEINPEITESLGLSRGHGVVITDVEPDSLGDEAGFQPGDIVREINRQPVRDLSDYRKIMASTAQSKSILFLVQREDNTIFLALRKEE